MHVYAKVWGWLQPTENLVQGELRRAEPGLLILISGEQPENGEIWIAIGFFDQRAGKQQVLAGEDSVGNPLGG